MIRGFREESLMNRDQFWLRDIQFLKIAPHLPTDTRGKPRVDDLRVISGIVHVLKSGGRWIDAPEPSWVCRRRFCLNHAAMAVESVRSAALAARARFLGRKLPSSSSTRTYRRKIIGFAVPDGRILYQASLMQTHEGDSRIGKNLTRLGERMDVRYGGSD
jgi:transposase